MTLNYTPWNYEVPPSSSRLIVQRDEYDLLLSELSAANVKSNQIEEVLLVSGYLAKENDLVAFLTSQDRSSHSDDPLTCMVEILCDAFGDYSRPHKELHAFWDQTVSKLRNRSALERIIQLLLEFYADIENAYIACGVVGVAIARSRRPAWWRTKSPLTSRLERWRNKLVFEIQHGLDVSPLLDKVNSMLSVVRCLDKSAVPKTSSVFVAASAYCFCCAEILLRRSLPSASLMMLNRSTEFVLTAVAVDAGIATISADDVRLPSGDEPGVNSLIRALVKAGKISSRFQSGHTFNAVNTSRNQLGFTHGLAHVSSNEASKALEDAVREIKSLDPTLGWWSKVREVRPTTADSRAVVAAALDFSRLVERVDASRLKKDFEFHAG